MTTEPPSAQSQDAGASSEAHDKPLRQSLADASVLLWYATREGKPVSEKVLKDIVLAQSTLTSGIRNPTLEGRFWGALRELAAAVKPASVELILATYSDLFDDHHRKLGQGRLVDARATKKHYTWLAIGVLSLLVTTQAYWFVGTTLRTDLETHRAELDGIAGSLRVRSVEILDVPGMIKNKESDAPETVPVLDLIQYDPALAKSISDLDPPQQLRVSASLDSANKIFRSHRLIPMINSESTTLQVWAQWNILTAFQDFAVKMQNVFANLISPPTTAQELDGMDSDKEAGVIIKPLSNGKILFDDEHFRRVFENAQAEIEQVLRPPVVELSLSRSKSILAILSQYILPLLYGLLGSIAYILRVLSSDIQNATFTRGSQLRYSLRWPQGLLGGMTVGLFFDPTQFSGFAVITPLGLAFLAGYGVELLFAGLDQLVRAFTGEDSSRPKAA